MNELEVFSTVSPQNIAEELLFKIENGELDPLKIAVAIKTISDAADLLKSNPQYVQSIENELSRYGKNERFLGLKISVAHRNTYDFSTCNDPHLLQLESAIKQRKAFLKSLQSATTDEKAQGEFLTPPSVKTTNYIKIEK